MPARPSSIPEPDMPSTEDVLRLDDLAARAELPVRTVRYYMQVGLIEAPPFRGRETAYPASYVNRLKAIRQLRKRLLPLERIAVLLEPLTPEQVALVADGMLSIDPTGRLLLLGAGPSSSQPRIIDPLGLGKGAEPAAKAEKPAVNGEGRAAGRARRREPAEVTNWRRVEVAPGVELQVDVDALVAAGRARGAAGGLRLASRLEAALRAVLDGGEEAESARS